MRKWWIAGFAAVLLVGCGGSGSDSGAGGGGGGGGGGGVDTSFRTSLSSTSNVQIAFLSGQNRRAEGSLYAELGYVRFQSGSADVVPSEAPAANPRFALDGYTLNSVDFSFNLPTNTAFKTYTEMPLRVDRMFTELADGTTSAIFSGPPVEFNPYFALDATVYPGRSTGVAIKLNDASLTFDGTTPVLDRDIFEIENIDPVYGKINSYFSDFVSFDLSGMATNLRPTLINGNRATQIHFSGDHIGISSGFDTDGSFNMLFPSFGAADEGKIIRPTPLGTGTAPGTWTLLETDPRDPAFLNKISSLQGTWKSETEALVNAPTFGMLIFPNSRREQDRQIVIYQKTGTAVTQLYQGTVRMTSENGTHAFEAFPIANIRDFADVSGSITGAITVSQTSIGLARRGSFTLNTTPAGFTASTGEWIMYAK